MGAAKRRGSREQRKVQAIARKRGREVAIQQFASVSVGEGKSLLVTGEAMASVIPELEIFESKLGKL